MPKSHLFDASPSPLAASPVPATDFPLAAPTTQTEGPSFAAPVVKAICSSQCEMSTGGRITSVAEESHIFEASSAPPRVPPRDRERASSRASVSSAIGSKVRSKSGGGAQSR